MKKSKDYIKLGVFVIAGLASLIILLYMIGKNRNLFDKTITVQTRFENVHGLMVGNNVRFAGIDVGTVKNIEIVNDSCIEVGMILKKEMDKIIKKNAIVTIGTEGFVGYKLINIENKNENAPYIQTVSYTHLCHITVWLLYRRKCKGDYQLSILLETGI